ncbi:MAG TPA: surface-adhesin E family protein [Herbaspirillum sp.]|nr:surface-adhesin E family protein [Herbaspirillum sp.]
MQKLTVIALKSVTGLAVALACMNAQAADWKQIGGTDAAELSIDEASITQKGDIRQAWSMWNFKDARPNNEATFPALKSYKDLNFYNCKDQTMRLAGEIIYADNNGMGDHRDHSDALKNTQFAKPAAGTVGEIMLNDVCSADLAKKPKKK